MTDHRQHPRKTLRMATAYQTSDGPRLDTMCADVSLGGMFIETESPAAFGSTIKVFLRLPGLKGEAIISAVVRWTKPTGMGVQFGVMGARETHAMMSLLR